MFGRDYWLDQKHFVGELMRVMHLPRKTVQTMRAASIAHKLMETIVNADSCFRRVQ